MVIGELSCTHFNRTLLGTGGKRLPIWLVTLPCVRQKRASGKCTTHTFSTKGIQSIDYPRNGSFSIVPFKASWTGYHGFDVVGLQEKDEIWPKVPRHQSVGKCSASPARWQ